MKLHILLPCADLFIIFALNKHLNVILARILVHRAGVKLLLEWRNFVLNLSAPLFLCISQTLNNVFDLLFQYFASLFEVVRLCNNYDNGTTRRLRQRSTWIHTMHSLQMHNYIFSLLKAKLIWRYFATHLHCRFNDEFT